MGAKGWLRRLERAARGEMISIPQQDGTVARFAEEDLKAAYLNAMDRHGSGEDAPPEHPLLEAARNSSDRWWRNSVYAVDEDWIAPVEDLSE